MGDRVRKSILNAEVNLLFYFLSLFFTFYSRKIFLNCLGTEFIGLTGTLGSILGYLNLAELGITASISYFLYKPLQSDNKVEVQEIMSVLGYLYNWIGAIIFAGGIIVSLLFPFIFSHEQLGLGIVYFTFYSFLGSSLIGYFINYRQILLSADQKNYLVAVYFQSAGLVKIGLQIVLALYFRNLYLWVSIEFLFGILGCIILNWKINKEYPWLKANKSEGRILMKKYPKILRNTRQIFIHNIKDFVLRKSDEIFIFAFVSLQMVAFYGNYMLIINKITLLFHSVLESVNASIGNLVAENDKKKIMSVFWELMTIRHFVAGLLCFGIYHFIEPFISLWLGCEYIMDHRILVLLVIFVYITHSRGVVDAFNHAYGLYADVWSAWTELIINVTITIVCGIRWGIIGILLGKIVSLFIIVIFWKPYYLFRSGFKLPVQQFWQGAIRYYIIYAIAFACGTFCTSYLPISPYEGYLQWLSYCILSLAAWLIIETTLLILFAKGARQCIHRIKSIASNEILHHHRKLQ
jgi:O-antigen/teichoic acid export membrane protein